MIGLTKKEMADFFQKDFVESFVQRFQSTNEKDPKFKSSNSKQLAFSIGECMSITMKMIELNNKKIEEDLISRGLIKTQ